MKVYVSKHRMLETDDGWDLTDDVNVEIQLNKTFLFSIFSGFYEERFYVQVSTIDANVLRKLKRLAKVGEYVYFGFWLKEENRLFQVQMMFQESGRRNQKYSIPATLTYVINGFPEILPISHPIEEELCL